LRYQYLYFSYSNVCADGRRGYFPSNYVEVITETPVETVVPTPEPVAIPQEPEAPQPIPEQIPQLPTEIPAEPEAAPSPAAGQFSHLYPKARVIYEHVAAQDTELNLQVGDELYVFNWDDSYWWQGELNGAVGYHH
jgi:hypothetical protein